MNRCYLMAQNDGMYVLVGQPKNTTCMDCVKEMKYSIVLVNDVLKLYLISSTKASTELLNETIQSLNGKIIKAAEGFELAFPKKTNIENSFLNLDINVIYSNKLYNSDSTNRHIKLADLWNTSRDYFEIDLVQSNNMQQLNSNLLLNVNMSLENKEIFSYSNSNSSALMPISQEFYSSVSLNPVFIPLK